MSELKLQSFSLDDLSELSLPAKKGLLLAGFILLFLLLYFADNKYQDLKYSQQVRAEMTLRQTFEQSLNQLRKFDRSSRETALLETQYDTLLKELPPISKIDKVLANITNAGTAEGLKFVYFRPEKENTHGFYADMPIKIELLGNYHQMGRFLSTLAHLDQMIVVQDFELIRSNPDQDVLTMQLTLLVYRSLNKAEQAAYEKAQAEKEEE